MTENTDLLLSTLRAANEARAKASPRMSDDAAPIDELYNSARVARHAAAEALVGLLGEIVIDADRAAMEAGIDLAETVRNIWASRWSPLPIPTAHADRGTLAQIEQARKEIEGILRELPEQVADRMHIVPFHRDVALAAAIGNANAALTTIAESHIAAMNNLARARLVQDRAGKAHDPDPRIAELSERLDHEKSFRSACSAQLEAAERERDAAKAELARVVEIHERTCADREWLFAQRQGLAAELDATKAERNLLMGQLDDATRQAANLEAEVQRLLESRHPLATKLQNVELVDWNSISVQRDGYDTGLVVRAFLKDGASRIHARTSVIDAFLVVSHLMTGETE